jgi:hypothetical protein
MRAWWLSALLVYGAADAQTFPLEPDQVLIGRPQQTEAERKDTLFGEVVVGTDVRIVNQRIKTGWVDGALYLEVHAPLEAAHPKDAEDSTSLTRAIVAATKARRVSVDWDAAERLFAQAGGMPTRISR